MIHLLLLSSLLYGLSISLFFRFSNWYINHVSGLTSTVSFSLILSSVVIFIVLPFISNYFDIFSKKRILQINISVSIVISFIILFLINNYSNKTILLVSLFIIFELLYDLSKKIDQIVRSIYARQLVTKNKIHFINRYLETIRQVIALGSSLLGFFIIKDVFSISLVMIVILILMIFAFIVISFVKNIYLEVKKEKIIKVNLIDTFKQINNVTLLFISILPYIIVLVLNTLYPVIVNSITNNNIQLYVLLGLPYGLGAIIGANTTYLKNITFRMQNIIFISLFLFGLLLLIYSSDIYIFYISIFILAFSHSSLRVYRDVAIMNQFTEQNLGKILSLIESIVLFIMVILLIITGLITDILNYKYSILILIVIFIASLIYLLFSKKNSIELK